MLHIIKKCCIIIYKLLTVRGILMYFLILLGLSFLSYVLSLIMVGIWTNNDAKRKNLNNRLWTAVTVVIPFCIGFAVYFIANPKSSIIQCPYCKYIGKINNAQCPWCGARLTDIFQKPQADSSNKKFLVLYFIFSVLTAVFYILSFMFIFV